MLKTAAYVLTKVVLTDSGSIDLICEEIIEIVLRIDV